MFKSRFGIYLSVIVKGALPCKFVNFVPFLSLHPKEGSLGGHGKVGHCCLISSRDTVNHAELCPESDGALISRTCWKD